MEMKLKSIKVTEETIRNLNAAAGFAGKKQYQIAQEASEDVLKKISAKIKESKGKA